jgi:ABC-type tungstate transport system permease subunit
MVQMYILDAVDLIKMFIFRGDNSRTEERLKILVWIRLNKVPENLEWLYYTGRL